MSRGVGEWGSGFISEVAELAKSFGNAGKSKVLATFATGGFVGNVGKTKLLASFATAGFSHRLEAYATG